MALEPVSSEETSCLSLTTPSTLSLTPKSPPSRDPSLSLSLRASSISTLQSTESKKEPTYSAMRMIASSKMSVPTSSEEEDSVVLPKKASVSSDDMGELKDPRLSVCRPPMTFPSTFKLTVLGDQGCGKTSLIQRYVSGTHSEIHIPTQVEKTFSHVENFHDKLLPLKIVDTPSPPSRPDDMIDSHGFLICFAANCRESFRELGFYYRLIDNGRDLAYAAVVVVATMCDDNRGRKVKTKEATAFCKGLNLKYYETEARVGRSGIAKAVRRALVEYQAVLMDRLEYAKEMARKRCNCKSCRKLGRTCCFCCLWERTGRSF